jgi:hypothetical protein
MHVSGDVRWTQHGEYNKGLKLINFMPHANEVQLQKVSTSLFTQSSTKNRHSYTSCTNKNVALSYQFAFQNAF